MSSTEVDIHLVAYDEASDIITNVGATMQGTLNDVENSTAALADAQDQISGSFTNSAMAMNSTALAGASLFMSFERIQNSQVTLDRANLMVERSTLALQKAQEAYNTAVEKYGPDSQQAKDAADKLSIAQDALTVAQERVGVSQRNYTNSLLYAALTVIPSFITVIGMVSNATEIWTGIQATLNAVMDANPIFLVIGLIAGLAAGIIYLYNTCGPVRDAINAIGNALSWLGGVIVGGVTAAVNDIVGAFNFVAGAIGNFVSGASAAASATDKVTASTKNMSDTVHDASTRIVNDQIAAMQSTDKLTDSINQETIGFINAETTASQITAKNRQAAADAAAEQAKITSENATELTNLTTKYDELGASADKNLALIQKEFNIAFNRGDMESALTIVRTFADQYGISLSTAEQDIMNFKAAQATIPQSIEEQLVGKAQADVKAFQDCTSGKMGSLADDSTTKMQTMASDITSLIQNGLVGEAQSAMQAYTSCSTNKVATMATDINTQMTKLTTDHNAQIKQMADLAATLTGSEKDAVLSEIDSMNKEYENKLTQLRDWQTMLFSQMRDDASKSLSDMGVSNAPLMGRGGMTIPDGVGRPGAIHLTMMGPLVNIEGSADKATVDLASKQVLQALQTTIVEPTSSAAGATQKRIRSGSVFAS